MVEERIWRALAPTPTVAETKWEAVIFLSYTGMTPSWENKVMQSVDLYWKGGLDVLYDTDFNGWTTYTERIPVTVVSGLTTGITRNRVRI